MWTWREKSHSARITDKNEVKVTGVGGGGWDGRGAGFLVCNLHFGLFERQTLGCTGCGGDVRLCHSQTCGVCVCGEWVGGVRERERGGRQEGCGGAAAWDKRERETRELPWRSSG